MKYHIVLSTTLLTSALATANPVVEQLSLYADSTKGQPSLAVSGNDVYVLYTDATTYQGRITHYNLVSGETVKSGDLFDTIGFDDSSHNQSAIAVDGDGFIHVLIGMHNHKLKYYRSNSPGDYQNFTDHSTLMPGYNDQGIEEKRYTYPAMVATENGDVVFVARRTGLFMDGERLRESQQNEKQDLYHFDNATDTWSMIQIKGQANKNAYMSKLFADANNNVHIATVWSQRHSGDNTYQRGTYARYNVDGRTLFNASGNELTPPIEVDSPQADLFYPGEMPWDDLTNELQTAHVTLNGLQQPIIAFGKNITPDYSKLSPEYQVSFSYWDGGQWQMSHNHGELRNHEYVPMSFTAGLLNAYFRGYSSAQVISSEDQGVTFPLYHQFGDSGEPYEVRKIADNVDIYINYKRLYKVTYPEIQNQAPEVSITNPTVGDDLVVGDTVAITADATDVDGSVVQVSFSINGEQIALVDSAPYKVDWTPSVAGSYEISSVAMDDKGATSTTAKTVTVTEPSQPSDWTVLSFEDFEQGWGVYQSGGNDAFLSSKSQYASSGISSVNIQDNSGLASSFELTSAIDVATPEYDLLEVSFHYITHSMDNSSEGFVLEYFDGLSWQVVKAWHLGDFDNQQSYLETVQLSKEDFAFPSNMKIRFRCDASGNKDDVFIDDVQIRAKSTSLKTEQTSVVTPIEDAFVRDGLYSSENFNSAKLQVKGDQDLDWSRKSLLKFDIQSLTDTASEVILTLNVLATTDVNPIVIYGTSDHSWDESDVTWDTAPLPEEEVSRISIVQTGELTVNVTDFVNAHIGSKYVGFILENIEQTGAISEINSEESANPPTLSLKW